MKQPCVLSLLSIFLLMPVPGSSQADPQTFPDFPDSPTPGGQGGGGDKVPYIPVITDYFLSIPRIYDVRMVNRRIQFYFHSNGPVMRYNIVWSRPGKKQTASRWHDGAAPKGSVASAQYTINEFPAWDTDYTIQVQAESWRWRDRVRYQITRFAETTFRTPPNPAISDRVDRVEKKIFVEPPNPRWSTTLESKETAAAVTGISATTTQAVNRPAAYYAIPAGQGGTPVPPPPVIVPVPGPALPVVFSPPLLEDNAQLWACNDAAADEAADGACSGEESAQAYCQLRGAQSGPVLLITNAQPVTPVRAVNGDVCQNADACRVVSQLQCDH